MSLGRIASKYADYVKKPPQPAPAPQAEAAAPYQLPKELPEYFYQSPGNTWWLRNAEGLYTEYPTTHVRDVLLQSGLRGSTINGERLSPVQLLLLTLRQQHTVQWAGELAGFQQGVHEICGTRILVTKGPKLIKAARGEWKTLETFLCELLGEQVVYLYGWVKSALRALYAGPPFRPGQALALAGRSGCGKSLCQSLLTEIFGGRSGRPWQYLMGDTAFNEDLLSREHLMIEDEAASTDPRKRSYFGTQLKNLIANEVVRAHAKGAKGMSLNCFWRVSVSVNDEPENLMVLPPIDQSLKDKIILLRAFQVEFPFPKDAPQKRKDYRDALSREIPAFLHFLHGWKIPGKLADQRYGVKAYQDEGLLEVLYEHQKEFRLLELIDVLQPWGLDGEPFRGTASQLQDVLQDKDRQGRVSKLLDYHSACGQLLRKLERHFPKRVKREGSKQGSAIWVISR